MMMTDEIETVGTLLKAAREARGLTIETVAKEICVRSSYLKDIEAGHYDQLPEATFTVGFVKAYAKMLALDCDSVATAFKAEFGVATAPVSVEIAAIDMHVKAPRRGLPAWLSPVVGLMGVSACWLMLGGSFGPVSIMATGPSQTELAAVAAEKAQLEAVKAMLPKTDTAIETVASAEALTAPAVENSPALQSRSLFLPAAHASGNPAAMDAANDIRLEAHEDAWVRLANADGSELWSGVLRRGQSYRPQHEGAILLSTSNAGGLMVKVGSEEPKFLGGRGEIVSDVRIGNTQLSSLDGDHPGQTGSR